MGVVARAKRARGEVHLVRLDPTPDSEIQKTRPCLVVSPDELNQHLRTVIIAPMTTSRAPYPWRGPRGVPPRPGAGWSVHPPPPTRAPCARSPRPAGCPSV